MSKLGISVIMPVYNESGTVRQSLEDLKKELAKLSDYDFEIIAVNDGSKDDSGKQAESVSDIKVINHKLNRGYSASLKTGIKHARYDWILIIDSDGSHVPSEIPKLLAHVPEYDLVIGSRAHSEAHDTFWRSLGRRIITRFAEYISNTRIEDINSGFRIFKKSLAKKFWPLFPERFSFTTTLTVAAHVDRDAVKYVPVKVIVRQGGSSSIKPAKDFTGFLSIIGRLAVYFKPLKVFIPLSAFLFVLAIVTVLIDYFITGGVLDTTFALLVTAAIQSFLFGAIAEMIVKRFYSSNGE